MEQLPYQVVRWREGAREAAGGSCSGLQPYRREKCFAKPEEVIDSHHRCRSLFFSFFISMYSSPPLERPPCGSHKGGL